MPHIVIADDDVPTRAMVEQVLRQDGHTVSRVADGRAALASRPPSAVVAKRLDLRVARARVDALLSRRGERRRRFGDLVIDLEQHRVELAGAAVALTPTEFALLVTLSDRPGEIVDRAELMARVWGKAYRGTSRAVDVMVGTLRRKLGDVARRPRFISTVHGKGYRFVAQLLGGSGAIAAD